MIYDNQILGIEAQVFIVCFHSETMYNFLLGFSCPIILFCPFSRSSVFKFLPGSSHGALFFTAFMVSFRMHGHQKKFASEHFGLARSTKVEGT